jgi:hypothetical protein
MFLTLASLARFCHSVNGPLDTGLEKIWTQKSFIKSGLDFPIKVESFVSFVVSSKKRFFRKVSKMSRLSIVLFVTVAVAVAQASAANVPDKPVAGRPLMHPELRAGAGTNVIKLFSPVIYQFSQLA